MDRRQLIERWLKEVIENPLAEWEVAHLLPGDMDDPTWHPESSFSNDVLFYAEPEFALRLNPDGVPIWWSNVHPQTKKRLTREQRREWFLAWLGNVWDTSDPKVVKGAKSSRRRRLAIELLILRADLGRGSHTWEEVPFED